MRVYLGGGHEELMYDLGAMYRRLGYDVFEPGICGRFESKRGPRDPETTEDEAAHQRRIDDALRDYAAKVTTDHLVCFTARPTVFEHVMDAAGSSVEWVASRANFAHVILGTHAALFSHVIPTIWQFHGQQNARYDLAISEVCGRGGCVVCYCQQEADLFPGARLPVIHFGKNPQEWCGWTGEEESVFYVANSLAQRAEACHYQAFRDTMIPGKWWLAGENNERLGDRARRFRFDEFKQQMRNSRVFFALGTVPAPYTLAPIEAAMTGMPILTPWYRHPKECAPYALPDLLGAGCLVVSKPSQHAVEKVLGDGIIARRRREKLSRRAREAAVRLFSNERVDREWALLIKEWRG